MSNDSKDPKHASTDPTIEQIESLEPEALDDADMEKVSGGMAAVNVTEGYTCTGKCH